MYKIKNTPKNRAILRLQKELIKDLKNTPMDKLNLYYYIEELNRINLKYHNCKNDCKNCNSCIN